jgi:hypothetical protein
VEEGVYGTVCQGGGTQAEVVRVAEYSPGHLSFSGSLKVDLTVDWLGLIMVGVYTRAKFMEIRKRTTE